jgi:UDP-N-acetylmuramate dehydrogenase
MARPPEIVTNADLAALSTFRLPARAAELLVLEDPAQLPELPPHGARDLVLGGGSNTLFVGDVTGRIILNRLRGLAFEPAGEEVLVTAAAGEDWHQLVRECMNRGLHGLENLAMIPGSVGAAPMQNIGAYGVELAHRFERLTAWDRTHREMVTMDRQACAFGYRDSRFKSLEPDRYLVTSVTLRLSRRFKPETRYASLHEKLSSAGIEHPSPRQLAAAVMRLRRHRLPDPARLPNAGSFFKNPIVGCKQAESLLAAHPDLPNWPMADGRIKLGAGRMIEKLGWKGKFVGDAGVYAHHALVLINRGRATATDLLGLVEAIQASVEREFGLRLEPEPRLVGG